MIGLADLESRVEGMSRRGKPFGQIETVIERSPASDVQKSALWLIAWTYQEPRVQRRVAKEALAAAV